MAETLKLTILSPERKLLEGTQVQSITLPTSEGEIQVLPGHAAIIGTLHTGVFSYQSASGEEALGVISSGFYEVKDDVVNVMAETVELKSELDLIRARTAQQKAEAALQDPNLEQGNFRKYQLKLQRALIRQQAAGR